MYTTFGKTEMGPLDPLGRQKVKGKLWNLYSNIPKYYLNNDLHAFSSDFPAKPCQGGCSTLPMKLFGTNVRVQKLLFPEENGGQRLLKKPLSPVVGDVPHFSLAMSPSIGHMAVNVLKAINRVMISPAHGQFSPTL